MTVRLVPSGHYGFGDGLQGAAAAQPSLRSCYAYCTVFGTGGFTPPAINLDDSLFVECGIALDRTLDRADGIRCQLCVILRLDAQLRQMRRMPISSKKRFMVRMPSRAVRSG